MRAGDLSSEITIQKSGGRDPAGQPLNGWADVDTVWADVRFLNGVQAIKAGAVTSKVSASMRIWWRTDVEASMRVIYDGQPYAISSVLPDPRRVYVDLVCEATK